MTTYLGECVLRYGLVENQQINTFKYEMCQVNKALPLIPMQSEYMNGSEALLYRLGSRVPIATVIADDPKALIFKLVEGIKKLAQSHVYLEDLLLEVDDIYYTPDLQRLEFICLPLRDGSREPTEPLKRTLLQFVKVPAFAKQVDSIQMAALFELLYSDCYSQELLEKTTQILDRTAMTTNQESANSYERLKPMHQVKELPKLSISGKPLALGIYTVLTLGTFITWVLPMRFEAKLGITLLCLSLGLFAYQKMNHLPQKLTSKETKPKRQKASQRSEKRHDEKNTIIPLSTEPIIDNQTGEVVSVINGISPIKAPERTVFLKEEHPGFTLCIEDGENRMIRLQGMQTIGRNKGVCQIAVEHMSVGRMHAELHVNHNRIYIKDLNSLNGTYVNQVKIKANDYIEVKKGDLIKFGEVKAYLK